MSGVARISRWAALAIDLATGNRKNLAADPQAGMIGQALGSWFYDLDYDPARRTLFADDTLHPGRALLQIDELTGDWLVIAGRIP